MDRRVEFSSDEVASINPTRVLASVLSESWPLPPRRAVLGSLGCLLLRCYRPIRRFPCRAPL
eukprot:9451619-Pyramimonas_sp.AAC.2